MKRRILAISLIILGIVSAVLWEGFGRETILYEKVLVAANDIMQGQEITSKDVVERSVPRELLISNGFSKGTISNLEGKLAKGIIPKNAQINEDMIYIDDLYLGKDQSIYYIPSSWIASMSTSVRRGDTLVFYTEDGNKKIGEYKVAFAKNQEEFEVTNNNTNPSDTLDRTESNSVATHVEIICTLSEYKNIYKLATGTRYNAENPEFSMIPSTRFLLVQKF